jgi:hypothetical protein
MVLGRSGGSVAVALASISGAAGTSGGAVTITGRGLAGGGTNALGGLRNQQEVEPSESIRSSGNSWKLTIAHQCGGQHCALRFRSAENYFMRSHWALRASVDRISSSAWRQSSISEPG